ncbi:hypothetical protein BMBphi_gp007 [Bacillus phage vB_BthS_BMBphi]|nr:hypothetical protein BMBphi_gp007 [Bacillus phage vB_BthS_BMBphi]
MGKPVVFTCCLENEEWIKVYKHPNGVLIDMYSPSQTDMDENGQVVLNRLDAENLAYTIKQILEEN